MKRALITAFEPYDIWTSNSSWLTLVELTKELPTELQITTRLYPVDYDVMKELVAKDLDGDFDIAIHLGQAPGTSSIQLESFALNVATQPKSKETIALVEDAPPAYQTSLPLHRYQHVLTTMGIPTEISFHAGTYLCNGIFFMSQHLAHRLKRKTQSLFIHLPLDTKQVAQSTSTMASLPAEVCATGLRALLHDMATATDS